MSMTLHALSSPNPSILNLKFTRLSPIPARFRSCLAPFSSSLTQLQSFNPVSINNLHGFSRKRLELLLRTKPRVWAAAKEDDGDGVDDNGEKEARGEKATVPNFVSSQTHILTVSGLIGYVAMRGYISEPFFWTLLVGLYTFSLVVKKRDDVSSVLPVAAVGERWVIVLAIASYLALAISHHSKKLLEGKEVEVVAARKLPLPLLGVALAIGIRVVAKWASYWHLTWMVV